MSKISEQETRKKLIDPLLKESGFPLIKENDKEYEVQGMPNNEGIGFVDYVLWGDDGLPLAVVEAKKTIRSPKEGKQQAKLYADCLEKEFGRRPAIYYSNGYEHWFWDDTKYPPRPVQGFHSKNELELMMQRRTNRSSLKSEKINNKIVERSYQHEAIRKVTEAFEGNNERRSLLVMATGSGKTRVTIALVDLLMKCNWIKRVLFLADRVSLVKQATKEFGKHLKDVQVINLLKNPDANGRIYVSTYQTILNQINRIENSQRKFGVGYFDLVVVDEAHRSIYSKYKSIFKYFDSYLVGLTATPKDEVDRNTYSLFQRENQDPTFAFGLEEAISQGYLVPPKSVSVPLNIVREGLVYDDLSEDEKQQWDELEWGEEGPPEAVDSADINKWLFNQDTVDRVLEHLMTKGEKVASGDRIGKTIIFAKNSLHAEFIQERFDINYPQYKGDLARVITYDTEYAQDLIDKFSEKEKFPHIAISVDMLDTGIDIPEVVNLVFFKVVRSKTKFWQMVGRGTRLCKDLYYQGEDKKFFYIFDYCKNLEFFSANPETSDGNSNDSLDTRLFKTKVELLQILNENSDKNSDDENIIKKEITENLKEIINSMTTENVIVRGSRRYVEKYKDNKIWNNYHLLDYEEIKNKLSSLPTQLTDSDEDAKHFDYTIKKLQLCIIKKDKKDFIKLRKNVTDIASNLELQQSIPKIKSVITLILEIQTEEWWKDVTFGMLEHVRKRLRDLINLIEKTKKNIVYTNFTETIGDDVEIDLNLEKTGFLDFEKFKKKAREYLKSHENKISINKLKNNKPITKTDIDELEKILLSLAENNNGLVEKAKKTTKGLGLFVRSLIGLDKKAATDALGDLIKNSTANSKQIQFLNLIIEELTKNGVLDESRLYQAPFTDLASSGPEKLFEEKKISLLFDKIGDIKNRAIA